MKRPDWFEPIVSSAEVRPNDFDSAGHVNHAVIVEYFETGRWAWQDHFGLKRAGPIVPVVSRIEVRYRLPIEAGPVKVTTQLEADDRIGDPDATAWRVSFIQSITIPGKPDQIAAEANVDVAFIDADRGQLATAQAYFDQASEG